MDRQGDGVLGVNVFLGSLPEGASAVDVAKLKAGFDRINAEGKPIIGARVQYARPLAAEFGRLPPKERTASHFRQNGSRLFFKGGSSLVKF